MESIIIATDFAGTAISSTWFSAVKLLQFNRHFSSF